MGYLTTVFANLGFPSSILVEFLVLAKFADMVTALFGCIVPRGLRFPGRTNERQWETTITKTLN